MKYFRFLVADIDWSDLETAIKELVDSVKVPIFSVLGSVVVVWSLYIGALFIFAGDNEEKVKKAKNALKWYLIGLAIIGVLSGISVLIVNILSGWTI